MDIIKIELENQNGQLVKTFDDVATYNDYMKHVTDTWDLFTYYITSDGQALTPNQLSGNEPID